jgi:ubiquinone/menaquinone biosynthesis C-methylase UbiE
MNRKEIIEHNQKAWNKSVEDENCWTVICSEAEITDAKAGQPRIILSPNKAVPREWLGDISGKKILGLAAGGGQQGPLLAAAGAEITTYDFSQGQLAQDRKAAEKYGLQIKTVQGLADDLSCFDDNSFDMIINPCSNCFFPEVKPVWQECHRVLKPGGRLMYCFNNPLVYLFDFEKANRGEYELKYTMPYSDHRCLSEKEKTRFLHEGSQFEFGHSMEEQIGSMLRSGFNMIDLFEDVWGEKFKEPIDKYFSQFVCILAEKRQP